MQLAIPHAPRPVRLRHVPGAVFRLARTVGVAVVLLGGALLLGRGAGRWVQAEEDFVRRAAQVVGIVSRVRLPPAGADAAGGTLATVDVLYEFGGLQRTGTGLPMAAQDARALLPGEALAILVDPGSPDAPRVARWARDEVQGLLPLRYAIAAALLAVLALVGWELVRTYRGEVLPLRRGLLVWVTPDGELPATRRERVFTGSYHRDDVKHRLKGRIRPGRAPVRNGEKVLAAVLPSRPTRARVIDEDLAKSLGWVR